MPMTLHVPSPPILLALLVFGGYLLAAYLRGFLGTLWRDAGPWLQRRRTRQ